MGLILSKTLSSILNNIFLTDLTQNYLAIGQKFKDDDGWYKRKGHYFECEGIQTNKENTVMWL